MAAKDLTKETIVRELTLIRSRIGKTTEIEPQYKVVIDMYLHKAAKALAWECLDIPFETFNEQEKKQLE